MPTCEHGRRRRGCPVCERDEEIAELQAEIERLRAERWKCQRCGCEFPHTLGDEGVQHCSKCVELEATAFCHRKQAAEIERLQAIVDKRPTTVTAADVSRPVETGPIEAAEAAGGDDE